MISQHEMKPFYSIISFLSLHYDRSTILDYYTLINSGNPLTDNVIYCIISINISLYALDVRCFSSFKNLYFFDDSSSFDPTETDQNMCIIYTPAIFRVFCVNDLKLIASFDTNMT